MALFSTPPPKKTPKYWRRISQNTSFCFLQRQAFAQRYCICNGDVARMFWKPDTIFILAFAIIMLNTDLHSPNQKTERRMKIHEFIRNLSGKKSGTTIMIFLIDVMHVYSFFSPLFSCVPDGRSISNFYRFVSLCIWWITSLPATVLLAKTSFVIFLFWFGSWNIQKMCY